MSCQRVLYVENPLYPPILHHSLKAIARRWLVLREEIEGRDRELDRLVSTTAPDLTAARGVATATAAEMLLLVGDNPERVRSEGALAKLCGACPIPASSGRTSRHRLNRGGNRQANAALHRVVVTRMRLHQPTIDYVGHRTREGKTKAEIMRCLKRYVAQRSSAFSANPTRRPRKPLDRHRSIDIWFWRLSSTGFASAPSRSSSDRAPCCMDMPEIE